jgi:ribonuclease E
VRSVSSVALQLLRAIEETLNKGATHNLIVRTRSEVALYVLNHKRAHLRMLEERFRITITISADATVNAQQPYVVDRGEQVHSPDAARALAAQVQPALPAPIEEEAEPEVVEESEEGAEGEEIAAAGAAAESEGEPRGRRRRRRGRGRGRDGHERREGYERQERPTEAAKFTDESAAEHAVAHEDHDAGSSEEEEDQPHEAGPTGEHGHGDRDGRRRRRRGRRGGRRNRHRNDEAPLNENAAPDADLQHAAEDIDVPGFAGERPARQPREERSVPTAEAEFPPPSQAPQPAPIAAAPVVAPPPAAEPTAEPPRRRSTIREPAPISSGEAPPPAPAPAIPTSEPGISSTAPEPAAPKRGWWGKRLLGGN